MTDTSNLLDQYNETLRDELNAMRTYANRMHTVSVKVAGQINELKRQKESGGVYSNTINNLLLLFEDASDVIRLFGDVMVENGHTNESIGKKLIEYLNELIEKMP